MSRRSSQLDRRVVSKRMAALERPRRSVQHAEGILKLQIRSE